MKRLTLLLLTAMVLITSAQARSRKKRIEPTVLPTIEIITKVNDYWQQHHKPQVRSFWDEAAYHTGNMEACRLLGIARWQEYSQTWARHNRWMGAREQDPSKWKYQRYGEGQDFVLFGDWQICFQTYLDLFEMENGERRMDNSLFPIQSSSFKIARAIEVMDTEVRMPQTDFWWWADALYMVMPVMTKLYKTTGEVKYLDKLYQNFSWADSLMFDPEEQLYYRDAKYIYPKAKTTNGKKDFWARGDGWVLAGLAKVLSDMPADYRHRPFFEQRFRQLAQGVSRCQQPEGYWTRSMLDKDHAEGPETSGTAFFCYGLLWGMNHGLLDRQQYEPVIQRAWNYLVQVALQPSGAVGYVQPIGERAIPGQQLSARNEANFGVGAFLLAACEHLRYEDGSLRGDNVSIDLTVTNESNAYCQQVVAVNAADVFQRLGIHGGRQFVVIDAAGLEVPYQLSYDGKVLLEASVAPRANQTFTLRKGTPSTFPTVCFGQLYPERKDDYAWENDRGAYRVYGPALQQSGEHSYGTDVWSKNTPRLVVEQRYWTEDVVMMPRVEKLRRENRQRGDSLYRTISYHHDHGQGMDLYKVGATLGCGTPALMDAGQLYYPYCFSSYEILDNGPLRTTVHLVYHPTTIGSDTAVVEHRYIQLDKGSNFNRVTVRYDGLTHPVTLATGVVVHTEGNEAPILTPDAVLYADPTENPRLHNSQLFVATLFPEGVGKTDLQQGHALGLVNNYQGQPYTYLSGSAWSRYDVRTMDEWQLRAQWALRQQVAPLNVVFK